MNSTLTLDSAQAEAIPATASSAEGGFYERLFFFAMRSMRHGCLRIVYPGGRVRLLGDGVSAPQAEMRLRDPRAFFRRCILFGNIGFGESHTAGEWDTDDIAAVITWFIRSITRSQGARASSSRLPFTNLLRLGSRLWHFGRRNHESNSRRNISEHYDLGNDFYALWLDPTMTYSAARFEHAEQSLEDAQRAKYEALCRKLQLKPEDHVLEIGCGWGGFCTHAAREHGCRVTAVTISKEQFDYATARVLREGLADRVTIQLQDYRHVEGRFDKICSIEMLEAVGGEFLDTWFAKCHELLKPEGLLAFQAITTPDCRHAALRKGVDWIQKHIFPGSLLLSVNQLNRAANRTSDLFMHALEDLGSGYARTLKLWHDAFHARLDEVRVMGFSEAFIRKWSYYLKYCEAAFATRNISVIQAVYTRPNNESLHRAW
ncbi:MAG TPA: cyclopropane-fatty-acyl-phospholipid synthase [Verrucomicrobiales bacterium]|nr:cyclopropane-fatty-acyl-phospholipid synthase [Verrucomicrobiales bacterium]HRJ09731.1 cyclopropane-fatty-acyl-phospholipid synthase family protein [Prosthecobacter sp.]HRK14423.1 cyclopropane-fatty-acyl-phospholipid synthase family protein [Prosthecobacter sp.]